jgi:Subtilase family
MRLIVLLLFIPSICLAKLRVAIIDSGINTRLIQAPLCHPIQSSDDRHGTSVVDLIIKNAGNSDYCIEPYKVLAPKFDSKLYIWTLMYLVKHPPDILNLSLQGYIFSSIETELIKKLLDKGVIILAAAGNYSKSVSQIKCEVYPACDDPRIIVVGTYDNSSGHGDRVSIKTHENKDCIGNYCMSGTSQATAIETGRFIHFLHVMGNDK